MRRPLTNTAFARFKRGRNSANPARPSVEPRLALLMLISVILLGLSRLDHSLVRTARHVIADTLEPVLSALHRPVAAVHLVTNRIEAMAGQAAAIEQLTAENRRLRRALDGADELARRNGQLERLLKAVPEHGQTFLSTRLIATGRGPLAQAALIAAGRANDVAANSVVVGEDGLVGRVLVAGARSSRLLLLHDSSSRVPVMVGVNGGRGLLVGDGSADPRLDHVAPGTAVQAGDIVATSGVGGVFPRGLRVGKVVDTGVGLRVELAARIDRLLYVSVLLGEPAEREVVEDDDGMVRTRRTGRVRPTSGQLSEPPRTGP